MSGFIYKNNANSLIVGTLAAGATTLNVTASEGANFPSTFPFRLTLWDATAQGDPGEDSGMEVVHVTGRTTDALTIVRGQEGTADVEHAAGEKVAMLWTAGHFNDPTYGIQTILDGWVNQDVKSGSAPALLGTNVTAIPSANINFNILGTPTYETAQDWFDVIQSAGIISGFELDNSRNALELDVLVGTGIIKIIDSEVGGGLSFNFAGVQNVTLTADNINYIYLDYNGGTPQVLATTNHSTIELNRHFDLGLVYKNGTSLKILSAGVHIPNLTRTEHERLIERDGFTHVSGAILSETGTLNLYLTVGKWFYGHNPVPTSLLDTSVADTFRYTHYGTSSWIVDNATATAVDTTHYNDGTDTLATLTINAYGTQWVYLSAVSELYILYGTENGALSVAQAALPPTSIPIYMSHMGELIAKIIHRQDGTITEIQIVHDIQFTAAGVPNHNDTGGLQGGTTAEYFHLTSAQHTIATQAASTSLSGYLSTTDWDTFNNKAEANQTMYIGTTAVAINRATNPLTLAGITLTTPDIGTPSVGVLTNCTFPTLNQNTTGSAATLTTPRTIGGVSFDGSANIVPNTIAVVDESSDTTCFLLFAIAATGEVQPKTASGLTFNSSTDVLSATGFTGPLTGNCSGSAATVTGASQPSITSVGTLTVLQVDNININLNTISSTSGNLNITPVGGSAIVLDGTINIDAGVVTGATSISSTAFVGALTGNADTVTNATLTTVLTVNTGTLTLVANVADTSVLTIGAGAVSVSGANTGDQTITLTGDVTGNGTGSFAAIIAADAVTYAKMQNVVNDERIWGRVSGADGVVEELTKAQILTMLNVADGADAVEKIGFPAESMYPPITNPASLTEEVGSGAYAGQSHVDFDDTTAEHGVWRSPGIINYDGGNMTITMTAKPTTTPSGAVTLIFDIYAVGINNSEAYDSAVTVDTGVDITFNFSTSTLQTDMMIATAVIDPSNVANGDELVIELIRNVSDTLVGDGEIINFTVEYNKVVV